MLWSVESVTRASSGICAFSVVSTPCLRVMSTAEQPWQGAKLLAGMLEQGLLPRTAAREERLGQLWWQARERQQAATVFRQLAPRSGSARHWLSLAQLELEQQLAKRDPALPGPD